MCLDAVDRIVRAGRHAELGLDETAARLIERSWRAGEPALYGRMDLCWSGSGPPKLLEYNADTPTALFEASVVQWHWLRDTRPDADQFNSIHEKLVARWRQVCQRAKNPLAACRAARGSRDLQYPLTPRCKPVETVALDIADIGWSGADFIDLDNAVISRLFVYPWNAERSASDSQSRRGLDRAVEDASRKSSILPLLGSSSGHPNCCPPHTRVPLSGTRCAPRRRPRRRRCHRAPAGAVEPAANSRRLPAVQRVAALRRPPRAAVVGPDRLVTRRHRMREDADRITRNTSCLFHIVSMTGSAPSGSVRRRELSAGHHVCFTQCRSGSPLDARLFSARAISTA